MCFLQLVGAGLELGVAVQTRVDAEHERRADHAPVLELVADARHAPTLFDLHLDLGSRAAGRVELPPEPHRAAREHDQRHDDERNDDDRGAAGACSRVPTLLEPGLEHDRGRDLVDDLSARVAPHPRLDQAALGGDGREPLVVHDDVDAGAGCRRAQLFDLGERRRGPPVPSCPTATAASPTTIVVTPSARAEADDRAVVVRCDRRCAGARRAATRPCGSDRRGRARCDARRGRRPAPGPSGLLTTAHCTASSRATASASSMPATFLPPADDESRRPCPTPPPSLAAAGFAIASAVAPRCDQVLADGDRDRRPCRRPPRKHDDADCRARARSPRELAQLAAVEAVAVARSRRRRARACVARSPAAPAAPSP